MSTRPTTKFFILIIIAFVTIYLITGCSDNTVEGCLNKANERASRGDWKNALKYTQKATELAPENVSALVFRAIAAEKAGEHDLAVSSASKAVSYNPDSFSAQYTLGRLYSTNPYRHAEAMNALLKALRLNKNDANTLIMLCNVAMEMHSSQTRTYLMMLKRLPNFADDPALENQLGIYYVSKGNYKAARQAFLTACSKASNNPEIVFNTALFMDRYAKSKVNAKNFYRHYLRLISNRPEYDAFRNEVEARMRRLN